MIQEDPHNSNGATAVVTDDLLLDSGSVVTLDQLPAGANLTVSNGTTLDLGGNSVALGAVNLIDGTITNGTVAADSFTVANGSIGANLADRAGPASFTMTGDGVVELTGNNTYTGGTVIDGTGTLAAGPGGLGAGPVTFAAAGTLQALGDLTLPAVKTGDSSNAARIDTNGFYVTAAGGIAGHGTLTKVGGGTLDLSNVDNSGSNGLVNDLIVQGGFVAANAEDNLGRAGDSALVFDGGGLQATGSFAIAAAPYKEIDILGGGTAFDTNGNRLEIDAALGSGNGSVGGITVMDGSGTGDGVLVLTGANAFQGNVEIAGGMADFQTAAALPSTATILIDSGGALDVDPAGPYQTVMAWLQSHVIDATSSGALALAANSSEDIAMSGFPSLSLGAAADVSYSGTLTPCGDTDLLGGGPGILTFASPLTGDNVAINGNVALGGANGALGDLTVNGTFDLSGYSVAVATLAGSGTVESSSAPAMLTVGGVGGTSTFAGVLQNGSGEALALRVIGGTLVLTGANTYSGGTDVESGTVVAGNPSALGSGSLIVNGGALDLDGNDITVPELNGTAGTITNNGENSPATLTVDDPHNDAMDFGGTLQDGQSALGLATSGAGTLTLGGTDSLSGDITVARGWILPARWPAAAASRSKVPVRWRTRARSRAAERS